MSRVQLALNVSDIDEAVEFYSKLFATEPAKRRPGYANFAIAEPPLKLVLIENAGCRQASPQPPRCRGRHAPRRSQARASRLAGAGLDTKDEESVDCCYALQDKVWVDAPDGEPWEFYTVLADSDDAGMPRERRRCCTVGICCSSGARDRRCDLELLLLNRCRESSPRRLLAEFLGSGFLATVVIGSGIAAQTAFARRRRTRAVRERRSDGASASSRSS